MRYSSWNKTWNTKDEITAGPKKELLLHANTHQQQLKYWKLKNIKARPSVFLSDHFKSSLRSTDT